MADPNSSALYFPTELSIADSNCVVCMDDARQPVYCTTCKKLLCFECMTKCQRENGCANCRSKVSIEVYRNQCDKYNCNKHALLLTMICTDCNICICKQCIGKGSEHTLHAFKNIDNVRSVIVEKMDILDKYLKMVDGVQAILETANNIGICSFQLQNIHCFGIDPILVNNVREFVTKIKSYEIEELIQTRVESIIQIEKIIREISKNQDQEQPDFYDFEYFTSSIDISTVSYSTLYSSQLKDKHGNVFVFQIIPNHKAICNSLASLSVRIILLSGTPGRYELRIDCHQPEISFIKVLEVAIGTKSAIIKLCPNTEEIREAVLKIGLRPTNHKYLLQCARLYRQIVDEPDKNDYAETIYKMDIKAAELSNFVKDYTGTIWRIILHSKCENNVRYISSACIEHYNGAIGSFDFHFPIESKGSITIRADKKCRKSFKFGSKLHIEKLLSVPEEHYRFIGDTYLKFGVRPSVQATSSRVSIMGRLFSK